MQEIQGALTQQIAQAMRQNEDFCMRLEITLGRLRRVENLQALDALRRELIGETQNLLDGNHAMGSHLEEILSHVRTIKSDILRLDEELNRVHLLSLTDELTGLPNRRAFLRRLEDEVGRVQRYGNSLALALIDLDSFKAINDRFGHAAGTRFYAVSLPTCCRRSATTTWSPVTAARNSPFCCPTPTTRALSTP